MKKLISSIILGLALISTNISCTENVRARSWGGSQVIKIPCNQKIFDVTWKNTDLWYATRPMLENEEPVKVTFKEKSSFGLNEGTITFVECKQ